jgi:hypothetical protein
VRENKMARKSNNTALNNLADRLNSNLLDNRLTKEITYAAATTGAIGNTKLCDVTGVVNLSIFAVCSTDLAGATAKIEVGTASSSAGLIAQTTATDIDVKEIWHDATPDSSIELTSIITQKIVTDNVIQKISTAAISGGVLTYYILWSPISADGNVVLA